MRVTVRSRVGSPCEACGTLDSIDASRREHVDRKVVRVASPTSPKPLLVSWVSTIEVQTLD